VTFTSSGRGSGAVFWERIAAALLVVFGEFALFTVGLTAAFCLGVMWSTMALERLRTP